MLFVDIPLVIAIAILFGASGIPFSFWLLRQEKLSRLDKLLIGYTLGWIGVPMLFTLETTLGILYSPAWFWANWLALILGGLILLVKDKALPDPKGITALLKGMSADPAAALKANAIPIGMLVILALSVWLPLTSSGGLLYELDPYFYLEGVHQIITQGHNLLNDETAWFPLASSNHVGQPLYKYLLAPWYSLYNGSAPYSPYTMADIGSVYPPLAAGLAVFFVYLLFREMYDGRIGLLAAGLTAFMPFLLIKVQGGDAQIVPYSIFALFFFLAMLYMALRRESMKLTFLCGLAYGTIVLGSNVDILITFCLSVFFFFMGLRHVNKPDKSGLRQIAIVFGSILLFQLIGLAYFGSLDIKSWLETILVNAGMPVLAFLFPLAINWLVERAAPATGRMGRIAAVLLSALALAIVLPHLPFFAQYLSEYQVWGAYTQPLTRTIAEQAPGSPSYDSSLGFVALTFSGSDMISSIFGLINAIPTAIFNFVFNGVASTLNIAISFSNGQPANFPIIERTDSLMTLFFFCGITLLAYSLLKSMMKSMKGESDWPIYAMLLLSLILPITFMGLEKEKLITYLGISLIFAVAATFGEAAELLNRILPHCQEIMWALMIIVLLLEFGFPISPATSLGASLLVSSATPTFEQAPNATAQRFSSICNQTNPQLCAVEPALASIMTNPTEYFSQDLCVASLWPNTTAIPADMMAAVQYRCSFIPSYWMDSMEWIKSNVPADDRIISWWDYGHWINYFGMHDTVLRNDHASSEMIGRTAYAYLDGDAAALRQTMNDYYSRYAMMDIEIIGDGPDRQDISFGGKYSALNYLACAYANQTDVNQDPGSSKCETDHLWETIVIPVQGSTCSVSAAGNITGYVAYQENYTTKSTPATYCAVVGTLQNGQQGLLTYDLNNRTPSGDLTLHPAIWVLVARDNSSLQFIAIYDNEQLWRDAGGNLISSYPYRTTAFYSSTLYQGFMLGSIEGFDLVYDTPQVRIFRMQDQYYKPGG